MLLADTQTLRKRNFQLNQNEKLFDSGVWYEGNPFVTQLLNAYTLLIPEGERFIIRTCKPYLNRAEPELREELKRLFFQESAHSREHGRVLKVMRAQGLSLDLFEKITNFLSYRLLEPLFPLKLRLSTAAAIEHHNAVIAAFFLDQKLLRGARIKELRRLFLWHFAEEIEHKEVVFKLLQSISPSWSLRAFGLTFSFGTFLFYLGLGTLLLGLKTGTVLNGQFWSELFTQCRGRKGLFSVILKESIRYLKPSFHPRLSESQVLLDSALAELERLGMDRPKARQSPAERALPLAFREMMVPFLKRAQVLESRHEYFFSRIEGYEGSWVRSEGKRKLNFCTYSYLGLLHHPEIQSAAQEAIEQYGTGTHGVRLLGGNLEIHEKLESKIAAFLQREAAITFSSGFMTNLAVIGTLLQKGDYVLSDELNHASIVDGCRFSKAEVVTFRHNDIKDLDEKLGRLPDNSRKLIVVDGVYSMDGDIAPVMELIGLRDRHPNSHLMVDEAHSLGVLGARGRGIEEHFNCFGQIDVLMGTLSKTVPAQGGFIAGSGELIKYLRYNARGFVFSAALSPVSAAAALAAFEIIEREGEERRKRLMSNIRYFTCRLREEGFDIGDSKTAIVPILLKNEELAFEMARRCNLAGVYAMPVAYPAVAVGTERLRMNVTSTHRRADLDFAVQVLVRARAAVDKAVFVNSPRGVIERETNSLKARP
jgi:glycine C-acetyltransferase